MTDAHAKSCAELGGNAEQGSGDEGPGDKGLREPGNAYARTGHRMKELWEAVRACEAKLANGIGMG